MHSSGHKNFASQRSLENLYGGTHSTMDTVLALHPAAPGSMLPRFIDSTALLSIKWTVQTLNNVDRTHLVLLDSATKKNSSIHVMINEV